MKLSEIIDMAKVQFDDSYDNATYYKWFQAMLDDLSETYYSVRKVVLPYSVMYGGFQLPTNFKTFVSLIVNGSTVYRIPIGSTADTGFYIMDNIIYLNGLVASSATLFYEAYPDAIQPSPDYVPTIPLPFHTMFVTFACKQASLLEDEVDYGERYKAYADEYAQQKKSFESYFAKRRSDSANNTQARWVVER